MNEFGYLDYLELNRNQEIQEKQNELDKKFRTKVSNSEIQSLSRNYNY